MGTTLGDRLHISRRDLRMRQQELADRSGVSRTYISQIETGAVDAVMTDVLVKLANTLGVSVGYLLGQTDAQTIADDGAPIEANSARLIFEVRDPEMRYAVIELMDMVRDMTPPQRRTFVEMAQKLKRLMDGEYETAPIIIE